MIGSFVTFFFATTIYLGIGIFAGASCFAFLTLIAHPVWGVAAVIAIAGCVYCAVRLRGAGTILTLPPAG